MLPGGWVAGDRAEEQEDGVTTSAVGDTGPLLHLAEIGHLAALGTLRRLLLPDLVAAELHRYGVQAQDIGVARLSVSVVSVSARRWERVQRAVTSSGVSIQPADAQVVTLSLARRRPDVVLTDDLALRRVLESRGVLAVGSVGLLIRAYATGLLDRGRLEHAVDALFGGSTLHLSAGFRRYVRSLLAELSLEASG